MLGPSYVTLVQIHEAELAQELISKRVEAARAEEQRIQDSLNAAEVRLYQRFKGD